jgi:hypothetical protein
MRVTRGHTADPTGSTFPALLRGWRTTGRPILSMAPRFDRTAHRRLRAAILRAVCKAMARGRQKFIR